jgi:hypothetical protein
MNDSGANANGVTWFIGPGDQIIEQPAQSTIPALPGTTDHGRIAVAPDNSPWAVNDANQIFHLTGGAWQQMPGLATDIGIGADGSVWVTGTNSVDGGFGIWEFVNGNWQQSSGGGIEIDVASNGQPIVANSDGNIFFRNPNGSWTEDSSGLARDVAVDHKTGQLWVIGTNKQADGWGVWAADGGSWVTTPDPNFGAFSISAGAGQAVVTRLLSSSNEVDTVTCQ